MGLAEVGIHIAAAMEAAFGAGLAADAWRWRADLAETDCAASLHALKLSPTQEVALIDALRDGPAGMALQSVQIQNGFLNLQFTHACWADSMEAWLQAPATFVQACRLPADLWEITIFWRYRILKTFQQAAKIAAMEDWITHERLQSPPPLAEISKLKSLLALGSMLQHKGDLQHKRTQMITQIEAQILDLWQQPILLPADPGGSAWRQATLRLSLAVADAVGAPLKQSMEEALRMQYS